MRSNKYFLVFIAVTVAVLFYGCGGGQGIAISKLTNGPTLATVTGDNVLPLTVNGTTCAANSDVNKPCVTVKLCATDGSNCQTIGDVLVDTGSFGFRVFRSVLNPGLSSALTQVTIGGKSLAECTQYGDGSADWGPIEMAGLVLGNEPMVQLPIEVIDPTFPTMPSDCSTSPDTDPVEAGYSGILGIGLFAQDCGSLCETSANADNGVYYACSGTTCTSTDVNASDQVTNPIALLHQDNNGVILELPSVSLGGLPSINGYLVLGIGTRTNNAPANVTAYSTDEYGDYSSSFNDVTYSSYLDSGSNALFFKAPSAAALPACSDGLSGFFCPSSTLAFSAINIAATGSTESQINFQIGNMNSLSNTNNSVFVEIGGDGGTDEFDWGLPFFMGRNVYVGLESASSSLGTGAYWAY